MGFVFRTIGFTTTVFNQQHLLYLPSWTGSCLCLKESPHRTPSKIKLWHASNNLTVNAPCGNDTHSKRGCKKQTTISFLLCSGGNRWGTYRKGPLRPSLHCIHESSEGNWLGCVTSGFLSTVSSERSVSRPDDWRQRRSACCPSTRWWQHLHLQQSQLFREIPSWTPNISEVDSRQDNFHEWYLYKSKHVLMIKITGTSLV